MKFPAVAMATYNRLKDNPIFLAITDFVLRTLRNEKSAIKRARMVHEFVDDCNDDILNHKIIQEMSPCKKGCAACCHTEVSVTPDEAELLALRVRNGVSVDLQRLHIQKTTQDKKQSFYTIPYELRACVFLGEDNQCRVYEDRPSVCRTNVVIGDAEQCSTQSGTMGPMRLVKTERADMAIMGLFMLNPSENDILPNLLWKKLNREDSVRFKRVDKSIRISKDEEL